MVSKEAIYGIVIWLAAVLSVGNAKLNESTVPVVVKPSHVTLLAPMTIDERNSLANHPPVLTAKFVFNQRDALVEELQKTLGVTVDGHYGSKTRKVHLERLNELNLPTVNVPAKPAPLKDDGGKQYNISSDPTHRCPQFEPLFAEYGLEPVEVFSYIAYRETRCNPKAVNAKFDANGNVTWTLNRDGSIDRGLLQINSCWRKVTQAVCGTGLEGLFDVTCNLKVAKYIMDNSASGLGNWNVWKP